MSKVENRAASCISFAAAGIMNKKTEALRAALDRVPLHELHGAIARRKERVCTLASEARKAAERLSYCESHEGKAFLAFACHALGVSETDMLSVKRQEPLTATRHVAMSAAREVLGWSLQDIARLFGRPGQAGTGDHTAIIYAVRRVRENISLRTQSDALADLWRADTIPRNEATMPTEHNGALEKSS